MSFRRIFGIMLQEYYFTRRSFEVFIDIFYWAVIGVVVWGYISNYLSSSQSVEAAKILLLGMVLWEIVRINQYSVSVGALWNIWSRNLSNMFITPLSLTDYIVAQFLSGLLKSFVVFILVNLVAVLVFNFNIFMLGYLNLFFHYLNLTIFAWWTGIIVLGLIFRYGTRIQALAWSLVFIFQPLSAAFFPIDVLPPVLQKIAYFFPSTYVFESARDNLNDPNFKLEPVLIALSLNIIYLALGIFYFNYSFNKSKQTGQFAKNEG